MIGYYYENMVAYSHALNSRAILRSTMTENEWRVEGAIPLNEIPPEKTLCPGNVFYFNFFRTIPGMVALAWSPTYTNSYHELERMGKIILE